MSDTMLFGVLNMPPNCWTGDALDQSQRHSYYKEAAERIYKDGLRIAELEKQLLARGGHNSDCPVSWKGECYCGWEEMKKSLMESVTK